MRARQGPNGEKPKGYAIEIRLIAYRDGKSHSDQAHYCGSLKAGEAAELYELLDAKMKAELRAIGVGA